MNVKRLNILKLEKNKKAEPIPAWKMKETFKKRGMIYITSNFRILLATYLT
jgi:hypothetical protein